jgi:hypothetical protein
MTGKPLLGELLVNQKLVPQETVDQALRVQVGGNRRLGHILVRMKVITDDQLVDVLSTQLDIPVNDISSNFSPDTKKILPRYLCRQYGVMPLSFKSNNVLELAMANPSDLEAINDLENYTGMVIQPSLARHSEIDKEIPKRIPLGMKDIFSPKVNTMANRIVASIALVCVVGLGVYTYDYIRKVHEGTVSVTADYILFHNHDLTVAVGNKGGYSLQGHGAFADGLYKAEFSDVKNLEAFIQKRDNDFSDSQKKWLQWALQEVGKNKAKQVIAKN